MKNDDIMADQYTLDHKDFCLENSDDAVHEARSPDNFEWWYFDATFYDGYSMASIWWEVTKPGRDGTSTKKWFIDFSVYTPAGEKISLKPSFDKGSVSISTDTCDVRMGQNRINGEFPKYNVNFFSDGLGADLTFENLVQGYKTPPDGNTYFSMNPLIYIGWTIAQPRAKVTGKLTVGGKEIVVVGTGYHDHNWGNISFGDLYDFWYWGRIFLPDHTIIYSIGQLGECMEHAPINAAITFEGGKLVDMTQEIYGEPGDFVLDKETGIEYPRKLILKMNSDFVKGEIDHKLKKVVESYPLSIGYPLSDTEINARGHGAVRFLSDCKVELSIKGQKVTHNSEMIHEFMKP